jgi:hypothetical protein
MGTSAEKLVKQCIKLISKTQELDYEELKSDAKKVIKMARNYDEQLLGMMEELIDLGNIGSEEELDEFDIEVLKVYCRIKELDDSVSDKKIRASVWKNIQEEFELDSEESDDDSALEDLEEEDLESSGSESDAEPERVVEIKEPAVVEVTEIKKKKKKAVVE